MIENVSLWHVTPVRIGSEFFDPTTSVLEANADLYSLVNDLELVVSKARYTERDYSAIKEMREFLEKLKVRINLRSDTLKDVSFCDDFPGIVGCIAKFRITARIFCYIMFNGTAVFVEYGSSIPFESEKYFSLPVFLERQIYEDDYCQNKDTSESKKPVYDFLEMMWKLMLLKIQI